ncbi:MAG: response regulator [Bacteroidota bacterium]
MNSNHKQFYIIDDDDMNNLICKMVISSAIPDATVMTFNQPIEALMHVKDEFNKPKHEKVIILLDINMPEMNGWQFLEALEESSDLVNDRFLIFMASSSVNPEDKQKAKNNLHILDFIEKPITEGIVLELSKNYFQESTA